MKTFISLMNRAVGICSWEKKVQGMMFHLLKEEEDVDKKKKVIALETYIHRDLRRHWNHSTPRAKNTCSRTEMASGRQGLLQSIDMVIGYLKHLKEHI